MAEPEHLTPAEVAHLLGVAPVTVRAWAGRGLKAERVTPGGHRRFRRSEVERFARERGIPLPEDVRGRTPRTLVVDDDPQVRLNLHEFFERQGVPHALAADGYEAGLRLATFRPQLVLCDLSLPGVDGVSLCRRMRADADGRDVRVVAMSARLAPGAMAELRASGVEGCLLKPLRLAEVATLVLQQDAALVNGSQA